MILIKILILLFISLNIFADDNNQIDSLTLTKIKKLVQKEEEIALAYKKYLLEKGVYPSTIATMKTYNYLPRGFEVINPFGKEIILILDDNATTTNKKDDKHKIRGFQTTDPTLKSNLYDYYYSNKLRTHTKAPLGINNSNIEIILSFKEKFIYENQTNITTTKNDAISATAGKYYLDTNGVLHWYQGGAYKFSVDKDLLVDESVTLFEADGKTVDDVFKSMAGDVIFAGQNILHKKSGSAKEYLGVDENTIIVQNPDIVLTTAKGLIQFGKQSGGMIVNGDIYTWGNNKNRITSIDIDAYKKGSNVDGTKKPVVTTLVPVRAKVYDNNSTDTKDLSNFYAQNYFSSPLRPRFVDLFSDTTHGTCAISTNGELFCGGTTLGSNFTFGNNFTHVDATRNGEMLYRSTYFDGTTESKKAKKIFANNQLWLILSQEGYIYRWGYEDTNKNGFSGNGTSAFNSSVCTTTIERVCTSGNVNPQGKCVAGGQWVDVTTTNCTAGIDTNKIPEKIDISTAKFADITYSFTIGNRKIAALSKTGELYLWGIDGITTSCTGFNNINLCLPNKVTKDNSTLSENITFKSIKGGLKYIIALGSDGKYYKVEQPINQEIQVIEIKNGTTTLPSDILSVDLTSNGTVVYVTSDNKLISTHFDSMDTTFKNTINSISWKSIKVLEDTNNSMCGLNKDNQMYCWGVQSYTDGSVDEKNTFMLPVFNTNLFDSTKDYLVAEGGASNTLTTMTSGTTWLNNSKFFINYPTYIGGFNYEVIFK